MGSCSGGVCLVLVASGWVGCGLAVACGSCGRGLLPCSRLAGISCGRVGVAVACVADGRANRKERHHSRFKMCQSHLVRSSPVEGNLSWQAKPKET